MKRLKENGSCGIYDKFRKLEPERSCGGLRRVLDKVLLIPVVLLLSSCALVYDDNDCPPGSYFAFRISTDWRLAPEADPEGMTFSFFRKGEYTPWMFNYPGRDGGSASLPEGCYGVVAYNNDAAGVIVVNDDSYYDVEATTLPAKLYADAEDGYSWQGEKVMGSPGKLWMAAVSPFRLTPSHAEWKDPFSGSELTLSPPEIIITPLLATPRIRIEVRDVVNLRSVKYIYSWVSGLRGGCLLSDVDRPCECVTHPFSLGEVSDSVLRGSLFTFGLPEPGSKPNVLTLRFVMSDESVRMFSFDITSSLRSSPDPYDMIAIVSGIELPDTGSSGGFDVSVDGWNVIRIDMTDADSPV